MCANDAVRVKRKRRGFLLEKIDHPEAVMGGEPTSSIGESPEWGH